MAVDLVGREGRQGVAAVLVGSRLEQLLPIPVVLGDVGLRDELLVIQPLDVLDRLLEARMQRRVQELIFVAEVVDVDVADAHRVQGRLQRGVGAVRDPPPVEADDRVDVRLHVPELRGDLGQLFERAGHRQAAALHELVLVVAPLDVLVVLGRELGSHVQRSVEQRVGEAVLLVAVQPAPQVRHPVQVVGQVQEAADRPVLEALAGGHLRQVRDVAHGQRDLLLLRIRHLVEGELDVQGFLHVEP